MGRNAWISTGLAFLFLVIFSYQNCSNTDLVLNEDGSVAFDSLPQILSQPIGGEISPGQSYSLLVTAEGSGLNYQWFRDGEAITPVSSDGFLLTIASFDPLSDPGQYTVVITNSAGASSESSPVELKLSANNAEPIIATPPAAAQFDEGSGTATLQVAANGLTPLTYVWKKDGATISGQNSNILSVPADEVHTGNYTVTITNDLGTVDSPSARLSILTKKSCTTSFSTSPKNCTPECDGGRVNFDEPELTNTQNSQCQQGKDNTVPCARYTYTRRCDRP